MPAIASPRSAEVRLNGLPANGDCSAGQRQVSVDPEHVHGRDRILRAGLQEKVGRGLAVDPSGQHDTLYDDSDEISVAQNGNLSGYRA